MESTGLFSTLIVPHDHYLGPGPHSGKPMEYEVTRVPDGEPVYVEAVYGIGFQDERIPSGHAYRIRWRAPWAQAASARDWSEPAYFNADGTLAKRS